MKSPMMKAARFYGVGRPLQIERVPIPTIKENEVLIKIKAVGLCGSDIHVVHEGITPTSYTPIILGHEIAGDLVKIGEKVKNWTIGTRVAVNSMVICGHCKYCLNKRSEICTDRKIIGLHKDGGLAEYLAVPAENIIKLPETVPYEIGAIVTDAVSTPYHALVDRAEIKPGESLVIFGAGGLGLHAVQIAKVIGASPILVVDINGERLKGARKLGADLTIHAMEQSPIEEILKYTDGFGVEIAAEFVGKNETIFQAVSSVSPGGRVVVAGLGAQNINILPPTTFVRKQLSLLGSYGFTMETIQKVIELVSSGRLLLSGSITHRFRLEEVNEALDYLDKKVDNPGRIVLLIN